MPDAIFCRYCGQKREAVHHGPPVESMNLFQTVLVFLCSLADPKRTPELWSCFNLRIFRMRCYAATPLFSSECSPPQVETQSVQSINYNSLFSGATGFFWAFARYPWGMAIARWDFLMLPEGYQVPGPSQKFLIVFPTTIFAHSPFPDNF